MTPPRRRASDQQDDDPMQTLLDDVALIKLHVAGGLGPDGPVVGMVAELSKVSERVSLLERIAKYVGSIVAGIIIGVSVWSATTATHAAPIIQVSKHP